MYSSVPRVPRGFIDLCSRCELMRLHKWRGLYPSVVTVNIIIIMMMNACMQFFLRVMFFFFYNVLREATHAVHLNVTGRYRHCVKPTRLQVQTTNWIQVLHCSLVEMYVHVLICFNGHEVMSSWTFVSISGTNRCYIPFFLLVHAFCFTVQVLHWW